MAIYGLLCWETNSLSLNSCLILIVRENIPIDSAVSDSVQYRMGC